ncbi:hypothetical protein C8F04DRAFT_1179436 [Mycena alexandri]|uniref:Uncharacterized protein n=1 Tax=Mycena alexandri TaxID=1745969 RepID=A0AAD6T315_9AGAR|nr:hypothetical protein C8F04DRAFT_1179436 [Mycena alexandri]
MANLSTISASENKTGMNANFQGSLGTPMNLRAVSALGAKEVFAFRLDMASELLTDLEAEARLIHSLLACAKAEARLAESHQTQAQRHDPSSATHSISFTSSMDTAKVQYTEVKAKAAKEGVDEASDDDDPQNELVSIALD